jgi:hypothetical protein
LLVDGMETTGFKGEPLHLVFTAENRLRAAAVGLVLAPGEKFAEPRTREEAMPWFARTRIFLFEAAQGN